jgi:galactokinase
MVRVLSEGYPRLEVDLADLNPVSAEEGSSAALVRGVAEGLTKLGHQLHGVDVYMNSTVLSGSGLSSSAAYEILIGVIFNYYFCAGKEDAVSLARIGQYAENVHFGKPCGLMDQMGSAVGGAVSIDFANPAAPHVHPVAFDFSRSGHALCIVDTGSDHADLTADYAAIPAEMGSVAAFFGKQYLREVSYELFWDAIPALRRKCGDRAVLRALHFYEDDARVARDVEALEAGDFEAFLANIRSSGLSSALHLQNIWSVSNPRNQAVAVTLALGERLLAGKGAIRVHGGGFAGTVQAFVPNEMVPVFRFGMETVLGRGKCHILHIRPEGGCVVIA